MSAETRTSYGIEKNVPSYGTSVDRLALTARDAHGRVYFGRSLNRRHVTTDALTTVEAKHFAQCVLEAVRRAEAEQAGAA